MAKAAKIEREWRLKKFDPDLLRQLERETGYRRPTLKALIELGFESTEQIRRFIDPDPGAWLSPRPFASLERGARILADTLLEGKKCIVHGDFDIDGIVATTIMTEFLLAAGFEALPYIPTRAQGHGISPESVEKIHESGGELIVTVDCGINAHDSLRRAGELGIPVIVTDHHLPDEQLPAALALIDPQLDGDEEDRCLSGGGVALRVCLETLKHLPKGRIDREKIQEFLDHAIVLAAISTIADVMPVTGNNRSLIRIALERLEKVEWPGLKKMFHKLGFLSKPPSSEDFAFQFVPRLNSAQRLNEDELTWKLFHLREEGEANRICQRLEELNNRRRSLQRQWFQILDSRMLDSLTDDDLPPAVVIDGKDWPPGISGLIASQFQSAYNLPAVIINTKEEVGRASCRAPEGYHLKDALTECGKLLLAHGGHAGAAGFSIELDRIAEFRELFWKVVRKQRRKMDDSINGRALKLMILDEIPLNQITAELVDEVLQLEPFGYMNPKPLFGSRGVFSDGNPKYIGKEQEHVMMSFYLPNQCSVGSIAFFLADEVKALAGVQQFDIAFHLGFSRGTRKPQLFLHSIRQHIGR